MSGQIILHNESTARWLSFTNPHEVIEAGKVGNVLPCLSRVEELVNRNGWYAAGFISYEAAPAFDSALSSHKICDFPLLWFGLYSKPEEIELPKTNFAAYSGGDPVSTVGRSEYSQCIGEIKRYIGSGDTYQVNYTLRLRMPFSGDAFHLLLAMVRAQSPGYAAWIDTGRFAVCSASPELFFRLEGDRLTCKPMKGTVRRGRWLEEDRSLSEWLHSSEKNRAENLMIVDMIRNDLGRVAATGTVQVPRMFEVERHPTLWQMTSTVTAQCGRSVTEILHALFPCASITGAPKIRTTEIIAELETTPRKLYTGCIGFISPGRFAQFNVAIRTAVVDRKTGTAEYGSGGGIVWDSSSDDEYTEALLKARVLTEQRPDFSLLETMLWTPEGGFFVLEHHLRRLADSAAYFDFNIDALQLREKLLQHSAAFPRLPQRVRLLVSNHGLAEIQSAPLVEDAGDPVTLRIAKEPVNSADIFLFHKTTHRRVYEAARNAFGPGECEDVLLWNERRELTESCVANVVVEIGGELLTPPVESGLLAGTFRALLLEQGIVREKVLKIDDLTRSSKVYLVNSVRKWRDAIVIP